MEKKGILYHLENRMTDLEYREYIREYLDVIMDDITEEDIDYYVWLWGGTT